MFAWSLVLPVLKYTVSLPRLVRLMGCRPGRERDRRVEGQIIRFAWAIYLPGEEPARPPVPVEGGR
jgi:hypothetical protein